MKNEVVAEKIKKALLQLNLTEKAILGYVGLLEAGPSTVQALARQTGVNRVTIYAAVAELQAKGLVFESRKGRRKLFVAAGPEELLTILENKKTQLHAEEQLLENFILPTLKAVDARQESRPQIKFFEGVNGINKVYDEYVLKSREVIACGSYDAVLEISNWEAEKKYIEQLRKKEILFRGVLEDTEINRKFSALAQGVMHNKFLAEGERVSADILVFGRTVALISYEKKSATLIEDKSIAQAIKMYLEFMWTRL